MNSQRIEGKDFSLNEKIARQKELEQEQYHMLKEVYSHYQNGTFLSIDMANSTKLKEGVDSVIVIDAFQSFHHYIREHIAESVSNVFSGDGIMCLFKDPQTAVDSATRIYEGLEHFNNNFSRLKDYINVRMGINTGPLLAHDTTDLGTLTERTIDIAGHLQKYGEPGQIMISEFTWEQLSNKEDFKKYWKKIDNTIVYRSKINFTPVEKRHQSSVVLQKSNMLLHIIQSWLERLSSRHNARNIVFALLILLVLVLIGKYYYSGIKVVTPFTTEKVFGEMDPRLINNKIYYLNPEQHLGDVRVKKGLRWVTLPESVYLIIPKGKNTKNNRIKRIKENKVIMLRRGSNNKYYTKWGVVPVYVETNNGYYLFLDRENAQKHLN